MERPGGGGNWVLQIIVKNLTFILLTILKKNNKCRSEYELIGLFETQGRQNVSLIVF